MANLYAGSYGYGGPGFYFDSSEEYDKKYKENLNKGASAPNEEYEIDFIDGSTFELAVFNAVEVHQGDVTKYFDLLDELDEDLMPAIHALTDYGGYDFKDALEKAEEAIGVRGQPHRCRLRLRGKCRVGRHGRLRIKLL